MHAFTDMKRGSFAPVLLASLISTDGESVEIRSLRAARCWVRTTRDGKPQLSKALRTTIIAMLGTGQNNPLRRLYPVHEGFGRTDALGRIGNTAVRRPSRLG